MIFFKRESSLLILFGKAFFSGGLLVLFCCQPVRAQNEKFDSLFTATLAQDSLLLEELLSDTTFSFLDLIDSLILLDDSYSSLSLRASYTSNVAYAGRNFGLEQHGFAAGISYYHKSGLYGDLSGYWNSDIQPNYNPTIATVGYMGTIGKKLSYMVDYDHYFYDKPESDELYSSFPLTNALNSSVFFDFKFLSPGVDYSFMFGEETAHRARGNLIGRIKFYDAWIFDRISISPGASVLAGNQNIFTYSQSYQLNKEEFFRAMIEKYGFLSLRRLRLNNPDLYKALLEEEAKNYQYVTVEENEQNVFGVMNYSFSAPFYFTINNFSLAISYSINFPVALPGEDIEYDPNSYFGVSLLYNLIFK